MCLDDARKRLYVALLIWGVLFAGLTEVAAAAQGTDDGKAKTENGRSSDETIYTPGKEVKAPKLIHYVEPEFSGEAKEAFVEGTVKISVVVTLDGAPAECKVVSGLTEGQDRRALDAVKQWRFKPGTKDGKTVKVRVTVEVGFHLL